MGFSEFISIAEFFLFTPIKKKKQPNDTYTIPDKTKKTARKLIDAAIARQDAEREKARREEAMRKRNDNK